MPRAGLTTQRVITEAATVADEVGLDRLTLAAVAQRCGVSLPGCTSTSADSRKSSAASPSRRYAN